MRVVPRCSIIILTVIWQLVVEEAKACNVGALFSRASGDQSLLSTAVVEKFGITASLLIPGRGDPIKDGAIIVEGTKIAWVGPQSQLPSNYSSLRFTNVPVIMPGLWDCHTHYYGGPPIGTTTGGFETIIMTPALSGARVGKQLEKTLLAGYTSVREMGGYAGEVTPAVDEGTIIGPHIYSSIAAIGMTAGHSDVAVLPLGVVKQASAQGQPWSIADGVPECIQAVRMQLRRGAKVIKVVASGGVLSHLDSPQDSQYSPEELKAMVDEAARAHRVVAAHCHSKESILNALHAGVKTIEHGSYLDEECIALMKEKNAILVATRQIVEDIIDTLKGKIPEEYYRKAMDINTAHKKAYALAVQSGVRCALGSDTDSGRGSRELVFAVEAGMTPLQAIEASTATAPETLGEHMAPLSGQLKIGYDADIIGVVRSPLDDISVLTQPDHITHVWKGGKLYKSLNE